jgi:hypothetical protein
MHWLLLISVLTALVWIAWAFSQKPASVRIQQRVEALAAQVGGVPGEHTVRLRYEGTAAEGRLEADRSWATEGRLVRLVKRYVWVVRVDLPEGRRASCHSLSSPEEIPDADRFLEQLAQLVKQQGQG